MTKLLIADDQPAITRVLAAYAETAGMSADVATDGQEAWDLFLSRTYDVVLLDIMMPKIDGFTLSKKALHNRRIRAHARKWREPITGRWFGSGGEGRYP